MSYVKPVMQKRNVTISDDDWELLHTLGGNNTSAGIRVAAMIIRSMEGNLGLIRQDNAPETKGPDPMAFANQVKDTLSIITWERLNRIVVETYDADAIRGLSFRELEENKRCIVFLDPQTHVPQVCSGLDAAFKDNLGHRSPDTDTVGFINQDHEAVAKYIHRYFTDSVS